MPRKLFRPLLTAALTAAAATGFWLSWPAIAHRLALKIMASRVPRVSKTAPNFTLEGLYPGDSTPRNLNLAAFRGRVVLLNFWATWCAPCRTEIPWFTEFQQELRPRGFTVLGVAMDAISNPAEDTWQIVRPFMQEQKINYPIVLGNDDVSRLYGEIDSLPTTLLLRRDGKIAFVHAGLIGKAEYRKEILGLLASP